MMEAFVACRQISAEGVCGVCQGECEEILIFESLLKDVSPAS